MKITCVEDMDETMRNNFNAMLLEGAKRELIEGDELAGVFEISYNVKFSREMRELIPVLMLEVRMGL
jgi:hypothetical protein